MGRLEKKGFYKGFVYRVHTERIQDLPKRAVIGGVQIPGANRFVGKLDVLAEAKTKKIVSNGTSYPSGLSAELWGETEDEALEKYEQHVKSWIDANPL